MRIFDCVIWHEFAFLPGMVCRTDPKVIPLPLSQAPLTSIYLPLIQRTGLTIVWIVYRLPRMQCEHGTVNSSRRCRQRRIFVSRSVLLLILVLLCLRRDSHQSTCVVTAFRPISTRCKPTVEATKQSWSTPPRINGLTFRGGGRRKNAGNGFSTALGFSKSGLISTWAVAVGGFLIRNYKTNRPWPRILTTGSRRGWNFVHAVSSTVFAGSILLTTVLEWFVVQSKSVAVWKFWFLSTVSLLDIAIVVPALTGAIVSGVAQSVQEYGKIVEAPKYVKAVLHTLATFGLWWIFTDRPTQYKARMAIVNVTGISATATLPWSTTPHIFLWRRASNVISCVFVLALYGLMVFKPGRPDLPPVRWPFFLLQHAHYTEQTHVLFLVKRKIKIRTLNN